MIPVQPRPEPADFDTKVRQPGRSFLRTEGQPKRASAFRPYWRKIKDELHRQYGGICAYTCVYLVGPGTLDHFLPKMQFPQLAYEWSNYRLASERANQRKDDQIGVLDPFTIDPHFFELRFPACQVVPGHALPCNLLAAAEQTIDLLKLNDDDNLVQERCDVIMLFRNGEVTFQFLARRYPFIAVELARQNLEDSVESVFKTL